MSVEADLVYEVENAAFAGTILGDHLPRDSFLAELDEVINHHALSFMLNGVTGRVMRCDATSAEAYAKGNVISVNVAGASRYVIVHELAHVLHGRTGRQGASHGAHWRAWYVWLTEVLYGGGYGDVLAQDFAVEGGLKVADISFPHVDGPLIEIDGSLVRNE